MGAASLKMKRKIATIPTMLLQPQRRMSHSVGFSSASKRLNVFLRPGVTGSGMGEEGEAIDRPPDRAHGSGAGAETDPPKGYCSGTNPSFSTIF